MDETRRETSGRSKRQEWTLAILVTLAGVVILTVGFFGGLRTGSYRFERMIQDERRTETLLGGLKHVRMPAEDMPGILAIYGLKPGEEKKLGAIAWVPPPAPAPLVGALARPGRTANAAINSYGFRDRREAYLPKPAKTYRVFVTGASTAFGSGAESDAATIAGHLETLLNRERAPVTGRSYEIVTAALPAWATTHERLLIENRLVDLAPDRIVMVSGFNDVLWGSFRADVRWFFTFNDQHFVSLLNQVERRIGKPPLENPQRYYGREPVDCATVAKRARDNVRRAAMAAKEAGAELVFALQPNIFTTAKTLTPRERRARDRMAGWADRFKECFADLRRDLAAIDVQGYRFVDLSTLFGEVPADRELFIDTSHFPGAGNAIVARELARALAWP